MVENNKQRVIVIHHPDFQLPGAQGINEAKNVGDLFLTGLKSKEMLDLVPEARKKELRKHVKQFKVYVVKLDKGMLPK